MSVYDNISQVPVGYSRNKVVRKWTEEQTDLFAVVLTLKQYNNGEETTWSEELETLAVKKSSNEHVFKEIQASLEVELVKVDQSYHEPGEDSTFSIPQLRAKYKWLKREWKTTQNKIKCGLLRGDSKLPRWFKRLNHIFTVYVDSEKDDRDNMRPSMVSEDGTVHNGRLTVDDITADSRSETPERSWVVNIDTQPLQELDETINKDEDELQNDANELNDTQPERSRAAKRPHAAPVNNDMIMPRKTTKSRKIDSHNRISSGQELANCSQDYSSSSCQCQADGARYVEIIKSILSAEERRERMFVDFQREQAQLNRQHELKMAQVFVDMASQQRVITTEISSIKDLILSKGKQF